MRVAKTNKFIYFGRTTLANEFGTAAFHVLSNVVEGGVWKP